LPRILIGKRLNFTHNSSTEQGWQHRYTILLKPDSSQNKPAIHPALFREAKRTTICRHIRPLDNKMLRLSAKDENVKINA